MTWNHFPYFALVAVLLWAVGAYAAWKDKKALTLGGLVGVFRFHRSHVGVA